MLGEDGPSDWSDYIAIFTTKIMEFGYQSYIAMLEPGETLFAAR